MIDLVNEYVGHPDNVSFAGVKSNILSKRVGALQVFGIRPQPSILNKCQKNAISYVDRWIINFFIARFISGRVTFQ